MATEGGITHQNAITGLTERCDIGGNPRITCHDTVWNVRQAEPFGENTEFDVTFDDFGKSLGACFQRRVAC